MTLPTDQIGELFPAVDVVFRHAVLDGDDGIFLDKLCEILRLLGNRAGFLLALIDVLAVLEELGRSAIERQHHVIARLVPGLVDGAHDEIERSVRRRQVRREAALVTDVRVVTGFFQFGFQRVENLGAATERFGESFRTDRHHHDFLEVDGIVGVHAAIDDVHHRHRQQTRARSADVTIQRHVERRCGCFGDRKRHAEDRVGTETVLVWRTIEADHDFVDLHLLFCVHATNGIEDFGVDGFDRFQHALARVTLLVAVAQLDGFMRTGRSTRRNRRATHRAVFQNDIDFDSRIAAAVENFTADDVDDGCHVRLLKRADSGFGQLLQHGSGAEKANKT